MLRFKVVLFMSSVKLGTFYRIVPNREEVAGLSNLTASNGSINVKATNHNSVYNQLLYVPVRAGKDSFSTNRFAPGKLIKVSVSRYRTDLVHATDHTRGRWRQLKHHHMKYLELK